ncbi:LysR family transcriptional regulator [Sedimentitalea sp. XS_ASV28]|uniref:LysR family transcriptional regulator n=1 Tax=Sedimentitalea sp. XS_ASV28 TaxID=3241296 RepID=UPI0035132093
MSKLNPFLRKLDLNLLITFDMLMQTRSATESARELNKTQPGVSRDLAKLRRAIGDPLMTMVHGRFEPTERAHELHAGVRDAIRNLEEVLRPNAKFVPSKATGVLNIGIGAHLELVLSGPLLQTLAKRAENIVPRFQSIHGEFDPHLIDDGKLDIAIGLFRNIPNRFQSERLLTDRRVAVMRRDHPLAGNAHIGLDDLNRYRFFAFEHMFRQRTNFDEALKGTSHRVEFGAYLSGFGLSGFVLEQSDYVTTMPAIAAAANLKHFDLVCRGLADELTPVVFYLTWSKRNEADPMIQWTVSLLRRIVAGLPNATLEGCP